MLGVESWVLGMGVRLHILAGAGVQGSGVGVTGWGFGCRVSDVGGTVWRIGFGV